MRTEKFRGILLSTLLVTSVIASLSIATLTHTSLPASAQVEEECGVEVTIEPEHKRGTPDTWLTFVVRVHNTGNIVDNYLLTVENDGWPMENIYFESGFPTMLLEDVQPCVTENVFLYVHIPENAEPCTHKEIVVWAESEFCGATDNDNALVQVVSKYLHNIEVGYPLEPDNWVSTYWHEIYPDYCQYYHLSSWEDNIDNPDGVVSPGDRIDLENIENENDITWYYVKDVTCTLVLEIELDSPPETWWYLEYENGWDNYCSAWWDPWDTQWNEIYPEFCNRYLLVDWIDGEPYDGILGWCDWVLLVDKVTWEPLPFWLHVVEIVTDLVLCEKVVEECGVEVTIDPQYQEGAPCENLYYDVTVHNTGTVVDSFTLSYIPDGWPDIWIEPGVLEDIAPCESKVATLIVHVPEWAEHCTEKEIVVIAESEFCGATDNDTAWAHVVVPTCGVEVTIEPKHKRGTPCTDLTFIVSVHNTGNIPDNYLLWIVPDGWPMENIILEYDVLLNVLPCETRTTRLNVHIPDNALPCTHKEIVVWAESKFCGATDNDNALVQVVSKYLHNIEPGYPLGPDNWVCWTLWHEIYPTYSNVYHLSSWDDTNEDGVTSPSDQIDITNYDNENDITWHYVKDVTITLVVELVEEPGFYWYLEYENGWDKYGWPILFPVGTQWNEILPRFCNRYHLAGWEDTGEPYGALSYSDMVLLVDKVTGEEFWFHVVNVATDLVLCEIVEPWTGMVDISLLNLYTLNVEKILDLNLGSKLVVKFYAYDNVTFENENVIETFVPPVHVEENENAHHPEDIGVKEAKLVLTDGAGAVIDTIDTFTVTRSILMARIAEIDLRWPYASFAERSVLMAEIADIDLQWPYAPV